MGGFLEGIGSDIKTQPFCGYGLTGRVEEGFTIRSGELHNNSKILKEIKETLWN